MIYYLPIEPLEERYTEQWYRWFPEEFDRQGLAYETIDGEALSDRVEVGTFLDINSTLHYKAHQLARVARLFRDRRVCDGDVFFVADVEFWGIEAIRYLADLNRVAVRMYGFAHAGSYTRGDFVEPCAPYARLYERAWAEVFDLLFVGSEYHKRCLVQRRGLPPEKIRVTGNPYDLGEARRLAVLDPKVSPSDKPKGARVVHTNRPDPEKRPELTLDLFEELHALKPDWELMVLTSRQQWGSGALRERAVELERKGVIGIYEDLRKDQYLYLLAGASVMTGNTIEENFGYCVLEAMIVGAIPVVPDGFSHPELVQGDRRCLFATQEEQLDKVMEAVRHPFDVTPYAEPYGRSLSVIVGLIGGSQ
jgi:glycosyltransferase involved in cell wall biosynthesis